MYEVTVKLISSAETERFAAMFGMAGKNMLLAKLLNVAAVETMPTINAFCRDVNTLYGTALSGPS